MSLIRISHVQGPTPVTIFEIEGRINLGNYKELEQAVRDAYDQGIRNLVLDFSGVDSLTSIGVRTLVAVHKMLGKNNEGKLRLAGVLPSIQSMLEIAGVAQFLHMHETRADAIAAF
jgi:anti-anti-sigma factor